MFLCPFHAKKQVKHLVSIQPTWHAPYVPACPPGLLPLPPVVVSSVQHHLGAWSPMVPPLTGWSWLPPPPSPSCITVRLWLLACGDPQQHWAMSEAALRFTENSVAPLPQSRNTHKLPLRSGNLGGHICLSTPAPTFTHRSCKGSVKVQARGG